MTSSTWLSRPLISVSPTSTCSGYTVMCGDRPFIIIMSGIPMIATSITSGGMKKIASEPKCGIPSEKPEDQSRYKR